MNYPVPPSLTKSPSPAFLPPLQAAGSGLLFPNIFVASSGLVLIVKINEPELKQSLKCQTNYGKTNQKQQQKKNLSSWEALSAAI